MPFEVILFRKNETIGSRKCETKTEADAYAKARQSDTISVIIVDDDSNEIVFTTEQAKESNAQLP